MSSQPAPYSEPHSIASADPETALKYAVQHIRGDRAEIVEGVIETVSLCGTTRTPQTSSATSSLQR